MKLSEFLEQHKTESTRNLRILLRHDDSRYREVFRQCEIRSFPYVIAEEYRDYTVEGSYLEEFSGILIYHVYLEESCNT